MITKYNVVLERGGFPIGRLAYTEGKGWKFLSRTESSNGSRKHHKDVKGAMKSCKYFGCILEPVL